MKRAKRTIVILSLALASCRGPVLSPTATPPPLTLRIAVTTTCAPLLDELAGAYSLPGALPVFDIRAASWATVHAQLVAGDVPYAATTYLPPELDLWAAPIGYDGIAIIVHPSNPVAVLAQADLRALFLGQIASWAALGGPDAPVTVTSDAPGTDLYQSFSALALGGAAITPGARLALSGASMIALVQSDPGAVGYVSLAALPGGVPETVRAVPLLAGTGDAVLPTPDTLAQAHYPLRVPVVLVGRDPPAPDSPYRAWFAWMQSSAGQRLVGARIGAVMFAAP